VAHRHCLVLVFGVPLTRCTNQKATASFVTQPKKAQPEMKAACAAALALALAVVLASPAAAFYEKNSAVVTLVRFPLVFLNIFFFFAWLTLASILLRHQTTSRTRSLTVRTSGSLSSTV